MTRIIRRTITTTIIETLTLIWVHTHDDDHVPPNGTEAEALARSNIVTYSVRHITASCHTSLLPAYVQALAEEEGP